MNNTTMVLIIMLGTLILFLIPKVPMLLTCMITCVVLYFTGTATASEALAGFSSTATWSIIGMSMMTSAFFSTGLADAIGARILRSTKGNQKAVVVGVYLIAALLSTFTSSLAVVLMLGPMVDALVNQSNGKLSRKMIWMPMAIGALLGGNTSLMGATNMLTTSGILEAATGRSLDFFAPAAIGFPPIIVGLIFYMTVGIRIMERVFDFPDVPVLENKMNASVTKNDTKITGKAKFSAFVLLGTVILLIMNRWNMGLVTFAATAILIATGCCTVKEAIDSVRWDIVLQLATMIGFAEVISSSGVGELIGSLILKITDCFGMGEFGVCLVLMVMCQVLSNFMSNNAGVVITVPIALGIADLIGADPYLYAVAAVVAVNTAFITPISCPLITLTLTAGYRFKDYIRANGLLNLLCYVSTALAIYLFYF